MYSHPDLVSDSDGDLAGSGIGDSENGWKRDWFGNFVTCECDGDSDSAWEGHLVYDSNGDWASDFGGRSADGSAEESVSRDCSMKRGARNGQQQS